MLGDWCYFETPVFDWKDLFSKFSCNNNVHAVGFGLFILGETSVVLLWDNYMNTSPVLWEFTIWSSRESRECPESPRLCTLKRNKLKFSPLCKLVPNPSGYKLDHNQSICIFLIIVHAYKQWSNVYDFLYWQIKKLRLRGITLNFPTFLLTDTSFFHFNIFFYLPPSLLKPCPMNLVPCFISALFRSQPLIPLPQPLCCFSVLE